MTNTTLINTILPLTTSHSCLTRRDRTRYHQLCQLWFLK